MNYRQRFEADVQEFISEAVADRAERMRRAGEMIDSYVIKYGERPPNPIITMLNEYMFLEEFTDRRKSKGNEEYPILSERQFARRYEQEYSFDLANTYDLTGKNHAKPIRRPRRSDEHRFVEREAQRKNRKRNAAYRNATRPGAVISYNVYDNGGEFTDDFVTAAGMAELWRNKLGNIYEVTTAI